jgi:hypothetical protein
MRTLLVIAAALAGSAAFAGGAQAQAYGPGPRPAYAASGYDYNGGGRERFTLLGARAGVTVLGVDLDASAGLRIGLHDRGGYPRGPVYAPAPYAEPDYGYAYAPPPQAYGPPPMPYSYAPQAPVYGFGYPMVCGC